MALAATVVWAVAELYLLLLVARMVLDLVMSFARQWRPRGLLASVAEIIFTATDPPIKLVRKVIPPLRIGAVALDLGFILVVIAVSVLASVAGAMMRVGP
jgi:YggT family protein